MKSVCVEPVLDDIDESVALCSVLIIPSIQISASIWNKMGINNAIQPDIGSNTLYLSIWREYGERDCQVNDSASESIPYLTSY